MGAVFSTALDLAPVAAALLILLATWLAWAALAARRGGGHGHVVDAQPARELPQPADRPADAKVPAPRRAHYDTPQMPRDAPRDTLQP